MLGSGVQAIKQQQQGLQLQPQSMAEARGARLSAFTEAPHFHYLNPASGFAFP